jgi:hypothetical protein
MLNRAPELFEKILLFIDRFHQDGHTCSEGFKLANFPELHAFVSNVAEGLNSFLQHFHSQVAFMKQNTFMMVMIVVIGVRNWLINRHLKDLKAKYNK